MIARSPLCGNFEGAKFATDMHLAHAAKASCERKNQVQRLSSQPSGGA